MAFTADINEDLLASVSEFRMITMASTDASLFYLRAMGGKVEAALDYFFRTGGKAHKKPVDATTASSHPPSTAVSQQQLPSPESQEPWVIPDTDAAPSTAELYAGDAEGAQSPQVGDAPWDETPAPEDPAGFSVPSGQVETTEYDAASSTVAPTVGYDADKVTPLLEDGRFEYAYQRLHGRSRHRRERFDVDPFAFGDAVQPEVELYPSIDASAREEPSVVAPEEPHGAAVGATESEQPVGSCPLAAESGGTLVHERRSKTNKRQRGGSPAHPPPQDSVPHVDVDVLKPQLREVLEKEMIRIRAERQEKLDLERAGNYVLHFTKVRELLSTLETPQWGTAQDFFAIFPREEVPEHGEAFLRLYRQFRHAHMGDVSAKLTNGELRFIRDLSSQVKAERESSTSDDDDDDDSSHSTEEAPNAEHHGHAAGTPSTVPTGRRQSSGSNARGGRGGKGGRGCGRGGSAQAATDPSELTSGKDSKPLLLPGEDSPSGEEEPTDSDAPRILRRRQTTTAAAQKRPRDDTEANTSPREQQTLPASASLTATRASTSTLRQRTLTGAIVQPVGGEIRPPRKSSTQLHLRPAQLTELLKRERAAMDYTRMLTSSGISYPVTQSNLPGELPMKTRVLLSTLHMDLSCVPEGIRERYPFRTAENVLTCLLLCCTQCTSDAAWSGSSSFVLKMFGILCDEVGCTAMYDCVSSIEKIQATVAAWRADFDIPPCTDETHGRLAETIALAQSFVWFTPKKREMRHLVEFTCTAPNVGVHQARCSIEIRTRPWFPRRASVESHVRKVQLMYHLCHWMELQLRALPRTVRGDNRPKLHEYPMLSWKSIKSLASEARKCTSFSQLVDAAAVTSPALAEDEKEARELPRLDAPPGISLSLKKHQQENLAFLVQRERCGARDGFEMCVPSDPKIKMIWCPLTGQLRFFDTRVATREVLDLANPDVRGGLLCDDMGLGKTLCLLSLMMANPMRAAPQPKDCKLSLLEQWEFNGLQQFVNADGLQSSSAARTGSNLLLEEEYLSDDEATESKPSAGSGKMVLNPQYAKITASPLTSKMLASEFYRSRHTLKPIKATLVVVPVSITGQWMAEIQRCAPSLRFMLFHGPDRHNFIMADFEQADVILTTYETLAQQIRGECMYAAHCSFAGRCDKETLNVLTQHVDSAIRSYDTDGSPLLPSIMTGTVPGPPYVTTETVTPRLEAQYFRDFLSIRPVAVHLSRLLFHRCIFDECQKAAGGSFDVVDHVHSTYRWAVTGTPIGNSIDTLGRLLSTIGSTVPTRPLSFFKLVDTKEGWSFTYGYSMTDLYVILGKRAAARDTAANKRVAALVARRLNEKCYDFVSLDLYTASKNTANRRWGVLQLLRAHMMRHCKTAEIVQDIAIPTRQEVRVGVDLTSEEVTLYERAANRVRDDYAQLCKQGRTGNRMSRVHMWIDVLQRSALHPDLVSESRTLGSLIGESAGAQNENERHRFVVVTPAQLHERLEAESKRHSSHPVPTAAFEVINQMMEVPPQVSECAVCLMTMAQPAMLRCHHFYCKECILSMISTSNTGVEPRCPTCRSSTVNSDKEKYLVSLPLPQVSVEEEEALAKLKQSVGDGSKARSIVALVESLLQQDPTNRFVVFSQFPSLLHRLLRVLSNKNITAFIIDGSTTLKERARRIAEFQAVNSNVKVCMISSRAGNAGLTLTAANHLILAEPNLNIAAEQQAASRIHRLGQLRPVTVHHMYTRGTIEERICNLVVSGQLAAQGGDNGDSTSRALNQASYLLS